MAHWPKSQVANVVGVIALAFLVPLTFTLAFPLPAPVIVGTAAVLTVSYYVVRTRRLKARAAHDLAVSDGFTFRDAVERMHERERAQAVENARRRDEFARTRAR
jgi:hypothetical protein